MRNLIIALLILLYCTNVYSQDDAYSRLQRLIHKYNKQNGTSLHVMEFNPLDKLRTPQSEVEDAILFLSKFPEEEAQFFRFFSTYAIKPEFRQETILTLSFILHSMVGISTDPDVGNAGAFYPLARIENGKFVEYRRVPNSETLWWIDLREFNWTPQAWETISAADGYFAEPIVTHDRSGALRLIAGNAVLRADWFIRHVMDNRKQLDYDIDVDFYSTLLYANTKTPTTIDEWRKTWGLDLNKSRLIGNEFGTLVTKSNAVARHNRMLFGYRTELGYMYETYDVKNPVGKRDYLESLFLNNRIGGPPDVSDAGEAFASNVLGLQVYALRDDKGDLISFGDPIAVRHAKDALGDVRVRMATSCLDCHAAGPIPSENTLMEFVRTRSNLKVYDKRDALRLKRNLFSERFKESIEDNQRLFARAVFKCNGLDVQTNGEYYIRAITRYEQPITLEVAAYECGVTPNELKNAILKSKYRFGARLKLMVTTGEPIPRNIWESPGKDGIPGAFQQAMIMLHGLTVITDEVITEKRIRVYQVDPYLHHPVDLVIKDRVVATLSPGYWLLPHGKIYKDWAKVYCSDGDYGYVKLRYLNEEIITVEEAEELFGELENFKELLERSVYNK